MSDASEDFEEAERRIEEATRTGATTLNLSNLKHLERIPNKIGLLKGISDLNIRQTRISDIAPLRPFSRLKSLTIGNSNVSDLTPLESLIALEDLEANDRNIVDISPLQSLTELRILNLSDTQVTDLTDLQNLSNLSHLALSFTPVADIAPLHNLLGLEELILDGTEVVDVTPLQSLSKMTDLHLSNTPISNISPLRHLTTLIQLLLENTQVSDLSALQDHPQLRDLFLSRTPVEDISVLKDPPNLANLRIGNTHVADLRPILKMSKFIGPEQGGRYISFTNTAATAVSSELKRLSEIRNSEESLTQTLAFLRTLPPYPAPLPWEIPADTSEAENPPEAEQSDNLQLVQNGDKLGLAPYTTPLDPVSQSVLEDVRPLLDTLKRKGNMYDDIYALADEMIARCEITDGNVDLLRLHLSYQKLNRISLDQTNRTTPFDDELRSTVAAILNLLPGATLGEPKVGILIARQEADRTAQTPATTTARQRKVLEAVSEEGAPFEDDVQSLARVVADPNHDDRLTGASPTLARNALVSTLKVLKFGGQAAAAGVIGSWAYAHIGELQSLATSLGDDIYFWARAILDKVKVFFEARGVGP